jgi:2-oxoglutarate dehydrogenase E2 component (dihydrolipoamide succinyltransferase)
MSRRRFSTALEPLLDTNGRKGEYLPMIDVIVPIEQEGTQAVVRAWLKSVGDRVEVNDPLVELETDKVAVEVPAPVAGVLREILLASNADAVPGAVLGRIAPVAEAGGHESLHVLPAKATSQDKRSVRPKPPPGWRTRKFDRELRLSRP